MAKTRHALIPLTLVTLLQCHIASAKTPTPSIPSKLRDDISAFIPACAEQCLVSFLTVNYARGDDTDQYLSLDFVCGHRGRSGYTIGEGALQCLTGEKQVGFCSDVEAGDVAFSRAYKICSGQSSVAQPNSGVITATLKFGPQSGVLTFAPITSSKSPQPVPTSTDSDATSSTTPTSTSSSTKTTLLTATSPYTLTNISPSSQRTTSTATPNPTPTQDASAGASKPLSKGQIAGISIGAVCLAAGFAFGLILLGRYLVRRHRRHSGSIIGSFTAGGGGGGRGRGGYVTARDTWGYGFDKTSRSNGSDGSNSWATHEMPGTSRYPPMQAASGSGGGRGQNANQRQQPYTRDSWRPSAIGLAISPSKQHSEKTPTPTPTRLRPLSKLLPAKPDMPPAAPKNTWPTRQASMSTNQDASAHLHPIAAQFMRPPAPSPPAAAATAANSQRPSSLRLVIPDNNKQPAPPPPPPAAGSKEALTSQQNLGRDSALTEFEEDDLRRSTSPAGQIWCPPSAAPDSAAAPYYVADGCGNWILGDTRSAAEKEMQSPLSAAPRIATATPGIVTMAVQTQIPARRSREPLAAEESRREMRQSEWMNKVNSPQELAATPLMHQHQHQHQQQQQQQQQKAEAESETTPSTADPKTPRMKSIVYTPKTVPSPLFSRQPNPRSASQPLPGSHNLNGRSLTSRSTRSRATSADSGITTFSISSNLSDDGLRSPLPTPGQVNNLSPVAESPRSRATASNTGSNSNTTTTTTTNNNNNNNASAAATAPPPNHKDNGGGGGVSPVSYPRIPGRGGGTPGIRGRAMFPGVAPPRMPLFHQQQQEMGQPSPTLGHMMMNHGGTSRESFQRQPPYLPYGGHHQEAVRHSRGGSGMPLRGRGRGRGGSMMRPPSHDVHMGPPPLRPPSQLSFAPHTGSPTMRMVEPSPEPEPSMAPRDDRTLLPSSNRQPQPQQRRRPPSHLPHPFPMYPQPRPRPAQQQQQQQHQQQRQQQQFQQPAPPPPLQEPTIPDLDDRRDSLSRYPGHPMPVPQPYKPQDRHEPEFWRPPHHPGRSSSSSPMTQYNPAAHDNSSQEALATTSSSSSSLLAKRLGTTRAANMALPPQNTQRPSARDRWQQSPQQQQQQGQGQEGAQSLQAPATPDLPSTPTWLPRLTPTRRGTDLVLNVG